MNKVIKSVRNFNHTSENLRKKMAKKIPLNMNISCTSDKNLRIRNHDNCSKKSKAH